MGKKKRKKKSPYYFSLMLSFPSPLHCYRTHRPTFSDLTLNGSAPESIWGIFNCNFYSIHYGCRHLALHTRSESTGYTSDKTVSLGGKP